MSQSPRFAPHARPLRRLGLVGVLVLAVFALTGCFAIEMKTRVNGDNTLSGTARIGVSKSLAAIAGGADNLLSDLKKDDPCTFGSKKGVPKDYDDGTFVGVECTFDNVSFADFNDSEDGPKISRDGDTFRLTGSFDATTAVSGATGSGSGSSSSTSSSASALPSGFPTSLPSDLGSLLPSGFPSDLGSLLPSGFPTDLPSSGSSAFPTDIPGLDPATILKTAKISFEFTFPGKVRSSKGQAKGNTVIFKPDSSGKVDFETVADAKSSGSAALWIEIGAAALVVAALAAFLMMRRNRIPAVAGVPDGYGGYPQGGPGFGQPYQAPDQRYQQTQAYPPQYPAPPAQPPYPAPPGQPPYPAPPAQPPYPAPPGQPPYSAPPATQPPSPEQQYPTQPTPQPPDPGYNPPPA